VRSFLLRVVKSTRSYHGSALNISEMIQLQDELTRPSFSYSKTSTAASRVWGRFVLRCAPMDGVGLLPGFDSRGAHRSLGSARCSSRRVTAACECKFSASSTTAGTVFGRAIVEGRNYVLVAGVLAHECDDESK
jgi:hypothetical protein